MFIGDAGLGFPPGAPEGIPDELSWHGIAHAIAPPVAFLALIIACFVLALRAQLVGEKHRVRDAARVSS